MQRYRPVSASAPPHMCVHTGPDPHHVHTPHVSAMQLLSMLSPERGHTMQDSVHTPHPAAAQVLSVLSPEWGYTMQDLTQFDFAAVLKLPPDNAPGGGAAGRRAGADDDGGKAGQRGSSGSDGARGRLTHSRSGGGDGDGGANGGGKFRGGAACAALLDVYGGDVAELFVVGTLPDVRRRGCARDLVVGALAPALADAGVRRLAVSVDAGDGSGAAVWRALGFSPLPPPEARWLAWQLPQFGREASEGSDYFWMDLSKMRGQGGY
eukprot:352667-Chlamydomonas_euryale.AAC.2